MTRRAGLIDSKTSVAQTPNLGSGAAHPASVQVYTDLARAAASIGDMIQPALDAETQKRARAAVVAGDFRPAGGDFTRQDQIYNKVIDAGAMAKGSVDVDRLIGELENKHLPTLNMDEFGKDLEAARTLYLEGTSERISVQLGQEWDQRALSAQQRLSGIATQKAIRTADEAMKARMDVDLDRISGASRIDDPDVSLALTRIESIGQARVAAGMMTQEQLDATMLVAVSRMTANRISEDALAAYQAGGFSDEAYSASLKMIDDAMGSPELALSRTERSSFLGSARSALNAQRSEIRAQEAELASRIRAAQAEALSEFTTGMTDARLRTGEGYAPSVEELTELKSLAARTRNPGKYLAQVAQLELTGQVQQQMRTLSIPQQERAVAALEMAAANGNADAARALDPVRKVAAASRKAAENDPATYAAAREGRDIPEIDWTSPDKAIDTMARRFEQAEIAADDLGVAPKYFSPADRAQLRSVAEKGGAPALEMITSIVQGADASGVDPLVVLQEVGDGGAPLMATAGALIAQGVPEQVAGKILAGRDAMGSEIVKDKLPKQSTQAAAQRAVLGARLGSMGASAVDAITRSADAYYATELLEKQGVAEGGEGKAYERAMRAVMGEWKDASGKVWGGQAKIRDHAATVPPWIAQKDFPSLLSSMTKDQAIRAMAGVYSLGKYRGREVSIADVRSARLIDAGAGMYYVAPDPNRPDWLVEILPGQPAILDLNTIRDELKQKSAGVR